MYNESLRYIQDRVSLIKDAETIIHDYYVQGDEFNSYDAVSFCQRFLKHVNQEQEMIKQAYKSYEIPLDGEETIHITEIDNDQKI